MFLPKLLFNPKGNSQHVSAHLDELSSSKDERQSDYSEAEEPADCKAPVKDCGKEIKGLKLKHEQSDGMASSYCSGMQALTPLRITFPLNFHILMSPHYLPIFRFKLCTFAAADLLSVSLL